MNVVLLLAGFLSVCVGYRLFCNASRHAIKIWAGALLAILGMALLVSEANVFATHKSRSIPAVHKYPKAQSPDWRNGSSPSLHGRPQIRLIA